MWGRSNYSSNGDEPLSRPHMKRDCPDDHLEVGGVADDLCDMVPLEFVVDKTLNEWA